MLYYVHNTSRDVQNRLQRYNAAAHRGLVQFIDGQRVIRGRPLVLGEEAFLKNVEVLRKGVSAGALSVRTADGRFVNLDTGEVTPAPGTPPLPKFELDSIKSDKPSGIPMPIYPDGAVQSVSVDPPAIDDEEAEVEHTEAGSGIKRGRKGRR
jgi:hypothetical protein